MRRIKDEFGDDIVVPCESNFDWFDVVDAFLVSLPLNERLLRTNGERDHVARLASRRIANFGYCLAQAGFGEVVNKAGEGFGRALENVLGVQNARYVEFYDRYDAAPLEKGEYDAEAQRLEDMANLEYEELKATYWHPGCGKEIPNIKCALCDGKYGVISSETRQGSNCCAWTLFEDDELYLQAGYGSDFDMSRFQVVSPEGGPNLDFLHAMLSERDGDGDILTPSPKKGLDPICDSCIRRMISQGILVEVGDGFL